MPFRHEIVDVDGPMDPYAKMLGDVNGDGALDIVIGGRDGPLVWYEYPNWTKHLIRKGGYKTTDGELGDINEDGRLDVVMGGLFWYENPDNDFAEQWIVHKVADHSTHDVELADLNRDGMLDIVTRDQSAFSNPAGNEIHVWIQENSDSWIQYVISCPHGEGLYVTDLNEDGRPDIIIGGYWYENLGQSVETKQWQEHRFSFWHQNVSVMVVDINNDGRKDIILTPSELEDHYYRISWFEAPEDRSSNAWTEYVIEKEVEAVYHSLAVADINRDGQIDIITAEMHQSRDPDEVVVYINGEDGDSWKKQILSLKGSHMLQAQDIDGDGDVDIVGANWNGEYQPIELWKNMIFK